jgi:hypothetical protein
MGIASLHPSLRWKMFDLGGKTEAEQTGRDFGS